MIKVPIKTTRKSGRFYERKKKPSKSSKSWSIATNMLSVAKINEPSITSDVLRTCHKIDSIEAGGLQNRLKTTESLARKIESDAKSKAIAIEESANEIHDVVRYTIECEQDDNFIVKMREHMAGLEACGYKLVKLKNYFQRFKDGTSQHKSITTIWSSPSGYKFEVQYNTSAGVAAKIKRSKYYKRVRSGALSTKEEGDYIRRMHEISAKVPDPAGVFGISEVYDNS